MIRVALILALAVLTAGAAPFPVAFVHRPAAAAGGGAPSEGSFTPSYFWTLDEPSSANRTNSTLVTQSLNDVNDVALVGTGLVGNSASFERDASSYLTNTVNAPWYTNTSISYGLWVKPTNAFAFNYVLAGSSDFVDVDGNTTALTAVDGTTMYWRVRVKDTNLGVETVSYQMGQPGPAGTYTGTATAGGTGTGATLTIVVGDGKVSGISATSTTEADGTYTDVTASGGTGTDLILTYTIACGAVTSVTIANGGFNYTAMDAVTTGACCTDTFWVVDTVDTFVLSVGPTAGGIGYTVGDDLTVSGDDISGASPANDLAFNVENVVAAGFALIDTTSPWNYVAADVTNTWTHWVGVADTTNAQSRLYSNGVLVASNSWGSGVTLDVGALTENYLSVGGHNNGNQFTGNLDGLFFHYGAVTPTNITFLYRAGSGREYSTNGTWTTP